MSQTIYRNSKNGEIVSKEYAEANRATTEKEIVRERFTKTELGTLKECVLSSNHLNSQDQSRMLDRIVVVTADTEN